MPVRSGCVILHLDLGDDINDGPLEPHRMLSLYGRRTVSEARDNPCNLLDLGAGKAHGRHSSSSSGTTAPCSLLGWKVRY